MANGIPWRTGDEVRREVISSSTVSIAVAQTCPVAGDVAANIEEHLHLAGIAADRGARLVLFPELSLTGYEIPRAAELAFTEEDPRLKPLAEAASKLSSTLVAGAPVRLGERLHIGAFILTPGGSVALYTKHRLGAFPPAAACDGTVPPAEATTFSPGTRNPLVRLGRARAALAVCADIGRPSHPGRAAARGATIYLASMFVIPSELAGDVARLRGYAAEHSMIVALANYGGPTGGLAAAGGSAIWSDSGELVAQVDGRGSGVAVAAVAPMRAGPSTEEDPGIGRGPGNGPVDSRRPRSS